MVCQKPRDNRLNWHLDHMLHALVAAQRSPDPNTQVGAAIFDKENRSLSTGYNAFPRNIEQHLLPWNREGEPCNTKYAYVVHAEENAILNATASLEGANLYTTMYPCNSCAKIIIQKGIKWVYYLANPYKDTWQCQAAQRMFTLANVFTKQLVIHPKDLAVLDTIKEILMKNS